MYYLCSENNGADQLREADLRLCFRICKNRISHDEAQFKLVSLLLVGTMVLITFTSHTHKAIFLYTKDQFVFLPSVCDKIICCGYFIPKAYDFMENN